MTFPVDIHDQKVNAIYDTGAGYTLINYFMYEKLGMNINKGYQPTVKSPTREDMGALGQVTFIFKINDTPFTQSFIVCSHMTKTSDFRYGFHSYKFCRCYLDQRRNMETDAFKWKDHHRITRLNIRFPFVLGHSVKIHPGGHLTVPLECTRPVSDRIVIGFHHRNPNVYIPPSFVNNPNNKYNPKYIPLTIFNLSRFDHLYIGRDTVIAFTDVPEFETYNVEIASEDKIKEHLAKLRN